MVQEHESYEVELRSDTFTKPSKDMLAHMMKAEVGDSIYDEDPTIKLLEKTVAEMFGKEDSLYMPSGTMANLVAAMVHCNERGSEIIVGSKSHFNLWEQGGISQIGNIYSRQLENLDDGSFDLEKLENMLPDASDRCCGRVKAVCIENSQNWCGGRILKTDFMEKLGELCRKNDIKVHLDGSRIMTVSEKTGVDIKTLCKDCDSINFCFSKQVGAPIGSILIGSKNFIEKALRVRQSLGGGMRQAGVLAAACLYGLSKARENIKLDLANAYRLASGIHQLKNKVFAVDIENIETNIVHLEILSKKFGSLDLIERLQTVTKEELNHLKQSIVVKVGEIDKRTVRLVTHLDVNANEIEKALIKLEYVSNEYSQKE